MSLAFIGAYQSPELAVDQGRCIFDKELVANRPRVVIG
jgi:hypothetical protein